MDQEKTLYYRYSEYLKKAYGEKVYKLPVNLPGFLPKQAGRENRMCFLFPSWNRV